MSSTLRRPHRPLTWLVVVSILAAACATPVAPPIGAGGRPFRPEPDEIALWARADDEADSLLRRVKTYDDPLLDEYLRRIVERLVPDAVPMAGGPAFRVHVLRDPALNAFAMPNGRVFVHTGLLSRLRNEAQLAAILGHEVAHVIHRHALAASRDPRTGPVVYTGTGALGPTASAILGPGLPVAAAASMHGYGRALERDADRGGMEALARAGYDPGQAPRLFETLRQEAGEGGPLEVFLFGNAARLGERIKATRVLARTMDARPAGGASTVEDAPDFQARMLAVVRDNALEDIRAGRFRLAKGQLDRVLAVTPLDAVAHLYYGDLHRLQAQRARSAAAGDDGSQKALARYERSIELDPTLAEPHRQLGLLYYQRGEHAKASAAFEKYLALKPEAADAGRIHGYIAAMQREAASR